MAEVVLKAEVRTGTGKGVARKLRAQGKVPAVMYGRGTDAVSLAVDARTLQQTLSTEAGRNVLIDLEIAGDSHLTLARELNRHPVKGTIYHVDFLKIARDQTIVIDVPIHIEGDSRGVKEGGVLEHHLWQLHMECLPGNVPERIHVDVSALGIGDSFRVSDVSAIDGVEILTATDEIIVSCIVPQILKVEEEVALEGVVPAEGEAAVPAEGAPAAEGAKEES